VFDKTCPDQRAASQSSHVRFRPRFIEENQTVGIEPLLPPLPPTTFYRDVLAFLFRRDKDFFLNVSFNF